MSCQFLASISTSWTQKASALSSEQHYLFDHVCFHPASNKVTGKSFLNLGRDPSGPSVNVARTRFIFSHLLFLLCTCPVSSRSPLQVCAARRTWRSLRGPRTQVPVEPVWPAGLTSRMSGKGVNGNDRCETGGLCKHMYAYIPLVMHACELQAKPAYKMWHSYIALLLDEVKGNLAHLMHSYLGLHRCSSML